MKEGFGEDPLKSLFSLYNAQFCKNFSELNFPSQAYLQNWLGENQQLLIHWQKNTAALFDNVFSDKTTTGLFNHYLTVISQANESFRLFVNDIVPLSDGENQETSAVFSFKTFYRAWLNCCEEAYLRLLNDPCYQEQLADWINQAIESE